MKFIFGLFTALCFSVSGIAQGNALPILDGVRLSAGAATPLRQAKVKLNVQRVWFEQVGNSMVKKASAVCQVTGLIDVYDFRIAPGGTPVNNFATCSDIIGGVTAKLEFVGFVMLL